MTFALTTMQLDAFLSEADLAPYVALNFGSGSALQAEYRFADARLLGHSGTPIFPNDGFYVQVGTVPSAQKANAREAISVSVLPKFIEWMRLVLVLPPNSTYWQQRPMFNATHDGASVTIVAKSSFAELASAQWRRL